MKDHDNTPEDKIPPPDFHEEVVRAARREIATWTKDRREGVQLQGIPNAPMVGTHL